MTSKDRPPSFETYRPGASAPVSTRQSDPAGGGASRAGRPSKPARRAGRARSSGGSGGVVSVLLYGLLGLAVLLVVAIGTLLAFPPTGYIRDQAIAQVKAATGRDLRIDGSAGVTLFPAVGITLDKVSLSAPPAMGGAPLVAMDRLKVAVQVMPLLSRDVVVDHLVLTRPVFNLRADRSGQKSWDFAGLEPAGQPIRLAQAAGGAASDAFVPGPQRASSKTAMLDQLSLGDVRIENGTVNYADEASGTRETVNNLNVKVALKSVASPVAIDGNLGWKGQQVDIAVTLSTLKDILDDRPATLSAGVTAAPMKAAFDGKLDPKGAVLLDGALSGSAASARALARWLGADLPEAKGFGPASFKGRLAVASGRLSLTKSEIGLDGANAVGDVTVTTGGTRPHIRADLKLDSLDLNKYMADGGGPAASTPGRAGAGAEASPPRAGQPASGGKAPSSIEDLIDRSSPQVKGYTQRAGWSNETIDVAALGAVDADLKLAVGRLLVKDLKVGRTSLTVGLKDRVMRTSLHEMHLYEGKGSGLLTLDGSARVPAISANLQADGVSARPLLKDLADLDWLTGNGKLALVITSRGASERQMIEGLDGTASFTFLNGAIVGFNIPQAVRALSQGQITNLSAAPTAQTDFSQLSANFKITAGIAENSDLTLLSPLLRLSGEGKVMLPSREVDYLARPRLVTDLTGQGGRTGISGLEIPVRIHGPWDRIAYTPDLDSVLKDPGKAVEAVKQLGEQLKGKKPKEILENLLGGGGSGQKIDGKKLLDGLLGGGR